MRLHNFFVEDKIAEKRNVITRDRDLIHQWRNVLRLNTGSLVVLLDNSGYEYLSQITSLLPYEAHLTINKIRRNRNLPPRIVHLYQSLIKRDRFEWAIEKGTELGVSHFHPVVASRSLKTRFDMKRVSTIAKEAAEQSGRGVLPNVFSPLPLESVLDNFDFPVYVLHSDGRAMKEEVFRASSTPATLGFFIGPEGGWTDQELKLFRERGIEILSLGNLTLRSETAAIAAAVLALV